MLHWLTLTVVFRRPLLSIFPSRFPSNYKNTVWCNIVVGLPIYTCLAVCPGSYLLSFLQWSRVFRATRDSSSLPVSENNGSTCWKVQDNCSIFARGGGGGFCLLSQNKEIKPKLCIKGMYVFHGPDEPELSCLPSSMKPWTPLQCWVFWNMFALRFHFPFLFLP